MQDRERREFGASTETFENSDGGMGRTNPPIEKRSGFGNFSGQGTPAARMSRQQSTAELNRSNGNKDPNAGKEGQTKTWEWWYYTKDRVCIKGVKEE